MRPRIAIGRCHGKLLTDWIYIQVIGHVAFCSNYLYRYVAAVVSHSAIIKFQTQLVLAHFSMDSIVVVSHFAIPRDFRKPL